MRWIVTFAGVADDLRDAVTLEILGDAAVEIDNDRPPCVHKHVVNSPIAELAEDTAAASAYLREEARTAVEAGYPGGPRAIGEAIDPGLVHLGPPKHPQLMTWMSH